MRTPTYFRSTLLRHLQSSRRCFTSDASADVPVHVPVLCEQVVGLWAKDHGTHYVDGTVGFGGHSKALLDKHQDAQLLCIDRDPEVLAIAQENLKPYAPRVRFALGSYADLADHIEQHDFPLEVDGILVDLGANSFHLDEPSRGFSFLRDGPLDMRFDQRSDKMTAADAVNTLSEVQLTKIFREFGEEQAAKEYARAIVQERSRGKGPFVTTTDLRTCIERTAFRSKRIKARKSKTHPATKCFQALRIYVNEELQHVQDGVDSLVHHLAPGGRLCTIAFHSLEDRPIKELFRALDEEGKESEDSDEEDSDEELDDDSGGEDLDGGEVYRLVKRKAMKASKEEMEANPRSRSARLRCLERVM